MKLRSIAGAAGAMLVISSMPALAEGARPGPLREIQHLAARAAGSDLFSIFRRKHDDAPVVLAQAADPRVTQLEEEIRKLSGTIEELNFQVLQMQEQIRKMQEDNEFRFQELEKGGGTPPKKSDAAPAEPGNGEAAGASDTAAAEPAAPAVQDGSQQDGSQQGATQDPGTAMPGVDLGTLTVDQNGEVKSSTLEKPMQPADDAAAAASDGTTVAALPTSDDPDAVYRSAYDQILAGDYAGAEAGFRQHIDRFPADPKTADARYWLGEALLGQAKYRDAAEVFLAANRDYPKSPKAPDMLLKLGVSLTELDQRDVACATFKEVGKRYPKASDALKQRLKQEQAEAGC